MDLSCVSWILKLRILWEYSKTTGCWEWWPLAQLHGICPSKTHLIPLVAEGALSALEMQRRWVLLHVLHWINISTATRVQGQT